MKKIKTRKKLSSLVQERCKPLSHPLKLRVSNPKEKYIPQVSGRGPPGPSLGAEAPQGRSGNRAGSSIVEHLRKLKRCDGSFVVLLVFVVARNARMRGFTPEPHLGRESGNGRNRFLLRAVLPRKIYIIYL